MPPETLKKSKATPYTIQDKIKSITPGIAGLPTPKNPKRKTHANSDINITILIPKRFKKNGIINIQSASLICDIEVKSVALLAAKVSENSGTPLKLVRKGPANPFVTCKHIPSKAEKIKNNAIWRRLKSLKAFNPKVSTKETFPSFFTNLHSGNVKQYAKSTILNIPETKNCI